MKTKIYNNLIFSLLFVCSICGLLGGVSVSAQEETSPTTQAPTSESIRKGDPATLHLYSNIFGTREIKTTGNNQEEVSGLIQSIFKRFLQIIFTISGILMVVMLAIHGFRMIYAELVGNVSGLFDAKKRVTAAAFGTIVLLLSWIILDFIDPALLRPKLFERITQLRTVGQSNNLFASDLTIPDADKNVKYDKDTGTLTIKVCPEIKKGSDFELQVESIRKSLQQGSDSKKIEPQLSYQVLYADLESKTYVHDGEKGVPYEIFAGLGQGKDNYVGIIECKNPANIKLEKIFNAKNIVVFPTVSIFAEEKRPKPNTPDTDKVTALKKFWRGKPWSHKPSIIDSLISSTLASVADCTAGIKYAISGPFTKDNKGYSHGVKVNFRVDGVEELKEKQNGFIGINKFSFIDHTFKDDIGIRAKVKTYDASNGIITGAGAVTLQNKRDINEGFEVKLHFNDNVHTFCVTIQIPTSEGPVFTKNDYEKADLNEHCFDLDWTSWTSRTSGNQYDGAISCIK